jgi:signal transduction histidine kinase
VALRSQTCAWPCLFRGREQPTPGTAVPSPPGRAGRYALPIVDQLTAPPDEILARLKQHKTLGGVPDEELAWLASRGHLRRIAPGRLLGARTGVAVEGLHVVFAGRIAIYISRGGQRRKAMEWGGGEVTGLLPYSRMETAPGDLVAEEEAELLTIRRTDFRELTRECPEATARLVHVMLDRARSFTSDALQDEKLASLGRLAAGLAHELNNPASAAMRSAKELVERLTEAEAAARALGACRLEPDRLASVDGLRQAALEETPGQRSLVEQADHEDAIAGWLAEHEADPRAAEGLAQTGIALDRLDELAELLAGDELDAALCWIAAGSITRTLALEIEEATSRIHILVAAVQGFTHMDRGSAPQPVDVGRGLATTMTVLRARAKEKSASLGIEVEPDLPTVRGSRGELNQVWLNLIANALDAIPEAGSVRASAARDGDSVIVRVVDNGPGIPDGVREHIFEPFFTTKEVGDGMGLGLDIVRRLVERNEGEITVESRPGRTEFRVGLRVSDALPGGDP